MKKSSIFLRLLALCLWPVFGYSQSKSSDAIVAGDGVAVTSTDNGQVRGYIQNGTFNYKGIPYATAKRFITREQRRHF